MVLKMVNINLMKNLIVLKKTVSIIQLNIVIPHQNYNLLS